jgi:hypothetical protein
VYSSSVLGMGLAALRVAKKGAMSAVFMKGEEGSWPGTATLWGHWQQ